MRLCYANAVASPRSTLGAVADHLFALMARNIATDTWIFEGSDGCISLPGCIIASPSHPPSGVGAPDVTDQDYLFHWTRDAAITAMELAQSDAAPEAAMEQYLAFSERTQQTGDVARGCYRVDGSLRAWSEQSDGPALMTLALLQGFDDFSPSLRNRAKAVISTNLTYLLREFRNPTTNLWEETVGQSFFTRSVQRRCFLECQAKASALGLTAPLQAQLQQAASELGGLLEQHWDGNVGRYRSVLGAGGRGADLNADIVMAAVYGAVPCTDSKLLATASQVRRTFANLYAINAQDAAQSLGPCIGRYPEDTYDGDMGEPPNEGHPWAPCTCNFAELYYRVAAEVARTQRLSIDGLSRPFFEDVGLTAASSAAEAVQKLRAAGDAMLWAVVYHSDHLELSEQFDRFNGFEKSVRNLTWSYASFLSAVRARG